jgi:hypothetical protein
MDVNGLVLPEQLQYLLAQNRWKYPPNTEILMEMIGSSSNMEFSFLDLAGMRRESDQAHLIHDQKIAKLYGLASSKLLGKSIDDPNILDIDNLVMIAVNYDDEAICLDYRTTKDNPRVMVSIWNDAQGVKWREIAPDFNTFVSYLNL